MWIFIKNGFFSAVQHNEKPLFLLVRARFKGDLERIFKAHGITADVVSTPTADYPFRATIPKDTWASIVKKEAEEINYSNFKAAAHDGTERDAALMRCWSAMRAATPKQ